MIQNKKAPEMEASKNLLSENIIPQSTYEENSFVSFKDIGFVKLHRRIFDWEWYTDNNVKSVFLHCLLKANHTQKNWRGIVIERGSFITSYEKLAFELNLSVQQVRTAIKKLKSTNEITYQSTSQYSIIAINNYNQYQDDNKQNSKRTTRSPQADNKRVTTTKNDKNENNDKNEKEYIKLSNIEFTNFTQKDFDTLKENHGTDKLLKAVEVFDEWLGKQGKTAKQYIGKPHYSHFKSDSWVWEKAEELIKKEEASNATNSQYGRY
jgi:hypothetical protein